MRKSAAESLFSLPDMTSFLLVTPTAGTSEADLQERLNTLRGVNARPKNEVSQNDVECSHHAAIRAA